MAKFEEAILDNTKGLNRLMLDPKEITCFGFIWIFRSMDIANIFFSSDSPYRKSRSIRGRCVDSQ